jgi:hypothetical protein
VSLHSATRLQRVIEILRKEPTLETAAIQERLPVSGNLVARARRAAGVPSSGLALGCVGLRPRRQR